MDPFEPGNQRAQIANVLSLYCWAYDLDRLDQVSACYTRDAEVEFADSGPRIGHAAIIAELDRRRGKYRPTGEIPWHVVTNILIQPDTSDSVYVASWYSFGTMAKGKPMALTSFGRWDDRFVLEDGTWRLAKRRIINLNSAAALEPDPR